MCAPRACKYSVPLLTCKLCFGGIVFTWPKTQQSTHQFDLVFTNSCLSYILIHTLSRRNSTTLAWFPWAATCMGVTPTLSTMRILQMAESLECKNCTISRNPWSHAMWKAVFLSLNWNRAKTGVSKRAPLPPPPLSQGRQLFLSPPHPSAKEDNYLFKPTT